MKDDVAWLAVPEHGEHVLGAALDLGLAHQPVALRLEHAVDVLARQQAVIPDHIRLCTYRSPFLLLERARLRRRLALGAARVATIASAAARPVAVTAPHSRQVGGGICCDDWLVDRATLRADRPSAPSSTVRFDQWGGSLLVVARLQVRIPHSNAFGVIVRQKQP